MKKRLNIPKYPSELFSIESILVENNTLCIRGHCYDDGVLLGTQYDSNGFSFICIDAMTLSDLLHTTVDCLADYVKYSIKGHINLLYDYCRKHGLECNLEYYQDEI